ncbi:hypothetical protein MHU86_24902 [Fragilaria crotonensis]|nr:hypothetical protein MHU86_24902 [Fragilaria crotonensis]
MYADVISPRYGVTSLQQKNEIDNNHAERCCHETQSVSEEQLWNSPSFSVIRRWYKVRTQLKAMEGKIQQWCQNDTQAITDFGFLAPSAFGFRSATIPCKKCACSTCDALAVLEETCKTLIISKQQLANAEKEHAEAKNEHAEAENRMMPNYRSAKKDRALELLGKILADKAELVASHLNLISKDANLEHWGLLEWNVSCSFNRS